jgi:hypothetical protein
MVASIMAPAFATPRRHSCPCGARLDTSSMARARGAQAAAVARASPERRRSAGMTCVAKSSMLLTVR